MMKSYTLIFLEIAIFNDFACIGTSEELSKITINLINRRIQFVVLINNSACFVISHTNACYRKSYMFLRSLPIPFNNFSQSLHILRQSSPRYSTCAQFKICNVCCFNTVQQILKFNRDQTRIRIYLVIPGNKFRHKISHPLQRIKGCPITAQFFHCFLLIKPFNSKY